MHAGTFSAGSTLNSIVDAGMFWEVPTQILHRLLVHAAESDNLVEVCVCVCVCVCV